MKRDIEIIIDHPNLAMDRRSVDVDGRLHVTDCVLSVASVDPYLGREIPDFDKLGLDAEKIYYLYRTPAALEDAVSTFENMPLMLDHIGVSAADPQKALIAGTVSNVRWKAPKLIGDIAVWDAAAIEGIRSGSKADISCGYRYVPDMTPGTVNGKRYDGRMVGPMACNHVALVSQGRVAGATVADAMPIFANDTAGTLKRIEHQERQARENDPLSKLIPERAHDI